MGLMVSALIARRSYSVAEKMKYGIASKLILHQLIDNYQLWVKLPLLVIFRATCSWMSLMDFRT